MRDAVVHLQRHLWSGGAEGNAAYLDWKYGENPYLDARYVVLGWADDDLVGMAGAFGACWEAPNGDRMMLPCLADTVVDPHHAGGPLFAQLIDELVERLEADGVPWLLDFGDQPAAPAMLMRGWQAVGPWTLAVATPRGQTRRSAAVVSRDVGETFDLIEDVPRPSAVRHVRELQYLAWRFKNPLARHYCLAVGSDGYLVAHRAIGDRDATGEVTPATILECEASDVDVWSDLVDAALSSLPGPVVHMWARDIGPERAAALAALGFELQEPTGRLTRDRHLPSLLVRATAEIEPASPFAGLDAAAAWDLRGTCGRSWR
jgi:GNAT superfamily N-acetyltransferase